MSGKNKFGFAPVDEGVAKPRARNVGPMGAAIRDTADSLTESTDAKIEQRRQNAEDAKMYRSAAAEGLVLSRVALKDVHTDDLPRDRLELEVVAQSDEMEELKASIRARGQKEPVELYEGVDGRLQIKKGWRRFTALSQLFTETQEAAFSTIVARIEVAPIQRISRYVDMVEENVIREDLTFAEMAQVAITAAADPEVEEGNPLVLVGALYSALHKMKKSYIRGFVSLLGAIGEDLKWPKAVPRNLGIDVARVLKAGSGDGTDLRQKLRGAATPDAQNEVLKAFVAGQGARPDAVQRAPKQKFEFHVGETKVTARLGECRILSSADYASVPKAKLEEAIRAFEAVLSASGNPRITSL